MIGIQRQKPHYCQRLFQPRDITSCVLHLRADLGITEAGTGVSVWADQSGQGNNVTQGTDAVRPTFNSGNSSVNGQPTVDFTPNDYLALTSGFTGGSGDDYTVFAVAKADGTSYIINLTDSSNVDVVELGTTATDNWNRVDNNNNTRITGVTADNDWMVWGYRTSNASRKIYHNGAQVGSENTFSATMNDVDRCYIGIYHNGSTWPLGGGIAEVIVYAASLTDDELDRVESYLNGRYGIY